jgi:hypothetical protein
LGRLVYKVGVSVILLIAFAELLKDGAYNFPSQFYVDATDSLMNTFKALSDHHEIHTSTETSILEEYMISSLANEFGTGFQSLRENDMKIEFIWHEPPKVSLQGFYFNYGPFPVPEGRR